MSKRQSKAVRAEVASCPIVPRLLTIKQAATYCACAIWAIRQEIWSKELRACMIGSRFVIPREELDAFINRRVDDRARGGRAS
jgi:excisionase family DNA binding protein